MDPALSALLGVALGGLLSLCIEVYRSRSTAHEARAALQRDAYARMLALSARVGHEATMVARRTHSEFGPNDVPADPGVWHDGLARMSEQRFSDLSDDLTLVYEEIRLIGSDDVSATAELLMRSIGILGAEARSGRGERDPGFTEARQEIRNARSALRLRMRGSATP